MLTQVSSSQSINTMHERYNYRTFGTLSKILLSHIMPPSLQWPLLVVTKKGMRY